jgi:hypothetical protein
MMDGSELVRRALGEPPDDPDAIERARSRLLDAIHTEEIRRRRRRRLVLPAAATMALVVAAAVVVALVGPIGGSAAAAAELRRLGTIASSAEVPHLREGEYLLVVSDELRLEARMEIGGDSFTVVSRLQLQTWIARDGSSVRHTEVISSEFASAADRRSWEAAGEPDVPQAGEVHDESSQRNGYFWVDLSGVPREPAQLLAALRAGSIVPRAPGDDHVFLLIGDLLAQGDASPDLRAALFEAAARLEGIEEVGAITDPLGRDGIALALDGASIRTQLVFDPETADLLSIEEYPIGADGSIGPRMSWRAFQPATVVDSSPES